MKVRCATCGEGYLVNDRDAQAEFYCPSCFNPIDLTAGTSGPVDAPPSVGAPATPAGPKQEEVVCPRCKLHFAPRPAASIEAERPEDRPTVLVVEDMAYFREIAQSALQAVFTVKTASTVDEARASLAQGDVDLMVLDLSLDGGDNGIEFLRELPFKPCPILIYTARDESELYGDSWEELRQLGADDIVIKGMNVGESLLRKVGALLGHRWEEEDLVTNTVTSRE